MPRILIAEGEPLIASFLQRGLRANGYATRVTHDPQEVADLVGSGEFDVLVYDVRLNAAEQNAAQRYLRQVAGRLPLLLLVGRSWPTSVSVGEARLQTLVKPFRFAELLDRLHWLLLAEDVPKPTLLHAGQATLDLGNRSLNIGQQALPLSATQQALAEVLFRNAGQDLSLGQIVRLSGDAVRGMPAGAIEAEFRRLREKLGGELITTVGPVGYRVRADDA